MLAYIVASAAILIGLLALVRAQRAEVASRQLRKELDELRALIGKGGAEASAGAGAVREAGAEEREGLAGRDEPLVAPDVVFERKPTMEQAIGLVWVTRIGAALLAIGAIYFFQVAVERGWLGPWGRVGVGVAAGVVAIGIASAVRKHASAAWVSVLVGIGLAIALGAVWAAHALYQLVPGLVAFGAVTAIVMGAAALAATWRMQAVLGTATISAFVNLGALSTGLPGHAALVGYALVVGAVAMIVAADKRWPVAAMVVAPGAVIAFIVRHFGIVGIPLIVTSAVDAALAIGLAVILAGIVTWGARGMSERVRDVMHASAGVLAGGVAVALFPYAVFAVMALAFVYRVVGRERAPMLSAGIALMALLGLSAAPLPTAVCVALAAGLGIASVGSARIELTIVGVAGGAAALYLGNGAIAWSGAAAALLGAVGLLIARDATARAAAGVALALAGVGVVIAALSIAASAGLLGGLMLMGAIIARAEPAPGLAKILRALGLAALAVAAVVWAGELFGDSGAKTVAQTLALGAFGAAILAWGFYAEAVLDRWFGLATLGVAVLKLVIWDVFQLDVVARTLILVVFGVLLLVSGFLYARSVARRR